MTRDQQAFSLPEVLISTLLFMFIFAGLFTSVLAANKSWQSYGAVVRARQEVRKAVLQMSRDFRTAEGIEKNPGEGTLAVTFTQGAVPVTYSWSSSGAQANLIVRETSTQTRIVARHITQIDITPVGNLVTFDVTATVPSSQQRNESFRLVQQVTKRY